MVVGERGHILFSDDDGATWEQAKVPVQVMLTAVRMLDAQTGWTVGHDAAHPAHAGRRRDWQLVHHAPRAQLPLLDVWFRDADNGFAVGAFGAFLASATAAIRGPAATAAGDDDDRAGGAPLLHAPDSDFEDDFHLNAIVPAGPGRLYLAGKPAFCTAPTTMASRGLPCPRRTAARGSGP